MIPRSPSRSAPTSSSPPPLRQRSRLPTQLLTLIVVVGLLLAYAVQAADLATPAAPPPSPTNPCQMAAIVCNHLGKPLFERVKDCAVMPSLKP